MRILHTNMLRGWGGQSNRILTEALGAHRAGHQVAFAIPDGSVLSAKAAAAGMTVWEGFRFKPPAQVWRFLPDLIRLRRHLADWKPNLIHVHGSQDTWLVAVARALAPAGFPPVIRTKHNIFEWQTHAANKWLYRQCDAYVSISSYVDRQIDIYPGIGKKPRALVYSVPDLSAIDAATESIRRTFPQVAPGAFLWGSTGRLRSEKGFDVLLEAVALLRQDAATPPFHLLIAGDGSDREILAAKGQSLGIGPETLTFLGFRKDVPAVLRSLDGYVLASRAEGLGTAILEALAVGLPVVATRVGGIPDSVRHEETGLLVESENPRSIADGMRRIMQDAPLRSRLGQAAHRLIREEFAEPRLVEKTLAFYAEVLERHRG